MKKIGIISDTHIPITASCLPCEILKAFQNVDLILHCGDLVDIKVLEDLKKLATVKAVAGNMDSQEVVSALPQKEIIEIEKVKIGLIHGKGSPDNLIDYVNSQFDNDIDIIVFGHSHQALSKKIKNKLYFNPGSPTDKRFAPYNSYGLIYIDSKEIKEKIIKI
ncbi:MAG: metallophosphoesterase family protein [bacterium]